MASPYPAGPRITCVAGINPAGSGRARLGSTDSLGLEQAREKASVMRSQAQMGFNPLEQLEKVKSTPTFKKFVREKYIPYVKSYKRSWEFDQHTIEKRMIRIWGHKKLNEFKPGDLIDFQSAMVNQGFKPGTVNRYMAIIKHILNTAEKWDYIDSSPTRKVSRMHDAGRQERFLSPDAYSTQSGQSVHGMMDSVPH
ncbi:hypothetical protein [Desulfonatronospira thiodismutans]|uniref:hypothetical protein n=1 Tax=Desulfonatronospira thiodismutans TaxID=488939 RepID=UPI001185E970|nr:hypothetical protein [Desulfonatronospira thiodismutans]